MQRREFIQASMAIGGLSLVPKWAFAMSGFKSPVDIEIEMTARISQASLLPGAATQTWSYCARVTSGDSRRVQTIENSFLGPVIRLKKGEKVRIIFKNELPEASIVHWHGLDVPHEMDGHPHFAIGTGTEYIYEFDVLNRAGTYWYHPHPHGRTGFQVFQGLAGLLIIEDDEEQSLPLPRGAQDLAFVIQDRRFDDQNQFVYVKNPHDRMMGLMGDKIFINGTTQKKFTLAPGSYRFRLLNGSNARPYNLKWSDGRQLEIIGTDGGLLAKPELRDNVFFGPAERLEIVVHLTSADQNLRLISAPFIEGRGNAYDLLSLQIDGPELKFLPVPSQLSNLPQLQLRDAINVDQVKTFKLIPHQQHGWTIDGLPYDMHGVSEKETCKLGTMEVWEFDNTAAGMPHPIHIHGSQFQVLERNSGSLVGAFDSGWKDVVFLLPGDKVKILKKFDSFAGDFIYHCHILEHEDFSMMRNYRIIK